MCVCFDLSVRVCVRGCVQCSLFFPHLRLQCLLDRDRVPSPKALKLLFLYKHVLFLSCGAIPFGPRRTSQVQARGEYDEAEGYFTRALDIGRQVYGPTHPNVATGLSNLAGLLRCQGKLTKSRRLRREE